MRLSTHGCDFPPLFNRQLSIHSILSFRLRILYFTTSLTGEQQLRSAMSIFISSDYGSSSAITFDLRDDDKNHQNLIRFLEVAIALNLPILPLTWDPALEALGPDGATGRVNQSPFNNKISLAFKRFNPRVTRSELSVEEFRSLQYNSMISEITVLNSEFLRKHPNIIHLIGVCFELHNNSKDIFPVLVFAKASLGDLSKFRSQYSTLEPRVMMAICGEIAKAVGAMHQCGIVTVPVVGIELTFVAKALLMETSNQATY